MDAKTHPFLGAYTFPSQTVVGGSVAVVVESVTRLVRWVAGSSLALDAQAVLGTNGGSLPGAFTKADSAAQSERGENLVNSFVTVVVNTVAELIRPVVDVRVGLVTILSRATRAGTITIAVRVHTVETITVGRPAQHLVTRCVVTSEIIGTT